jgi:hypothetical protein
MASSISFLSQKKKEGINEATRDASKKPGASRATAELPRLPPRDRGIYGTCHGPAISGPGPGLAETVIVTGSQRGPDPIGISAES